MSNELSTKVDWNAPVSSLGMSLMDHLFERLEGIYPGKWRSSFKSASDIQNWRIVWSSAFDFHKITPEDIKNGLGTLTVMEIKSWTPDLKEFIDACKHKETSHACHEKFAALPKPNYPKEKALENLARMKSMISDSPLMKRFNQQEN